jgi:hypothetical protein
VFELLAWIGKNYKIVLGCLIGVIVLRKIVQSARRDAQIKKMRQEEIAKKEALQREKIKQQEKEAREKERQERIQRQQEREREIMLAEALVAAKNARRNVPDAIASAPLDVPEAPARIERCSCVYSYIKVPMTPLDEMPVEPLVSRLINFSPADDEPAVFCHGVPVGHVNHQKIGRMISDWIKRGDPIWAMITSADELKHTAAFDIYFYRDELKYLLMKNPDAKLYKLTGNKNDEMQMWISMLRPGQPCAVEYDLEKEKYAVLSDGTPIGYLPVAAARIVEENGEDNVKVLVGDTELDDSGNDIVRVYVFD